MSRKLGLITGYPGWLTSRFLDRLQQPSASSWQEELSRYQWRALVAPKAVVNPDELPASIVDVQVGDVRDPEAMRRVVHGVDLVLHTVGLIHPRRIPDLYAVNRDGAANLVRPAVEAGVRRFVYVSSNAAAGFAADPSTPMRESDPARPQSHYGRSKHQGELAIWEAARRGSTEAVVLRPTTFYGPHFPRRHLRAYTMARSGRPLLIGDGRNAVSMVYIDNLVECVGLALTRPEAAGQTYFAADEKPYFWREVFQAMGEAMGVEIRPRYLPGSIALVCRVLDRILGCLGHYSFYLHIAGEGTRHMGCSIDKAREELGYRPAIRLQEGMRRAVAWSREKGWL